MKIVLQKFIAESGYCSRRKAEELIRQGLVSVNGKVAELGSKAEGLDDVKINGKKLGIAAEKIYVILNKPKGYTCTNRQFEGEKNVFDLLKTSPRPSPSQGEGAIERLFVVGRLDKESRGLVLLTNDGDLTQKLTHPKYEHEKEYIATITNYELRITNDKIIAKIKKGIDIGEGDGVVKAKDIKYLGNDKFRIILTEGKKRQIKRMFWSLGCEVKDLVRVRIGKTKLGDLAEGKYKKIRITDI
jgi:pseudouridine synthase